MQVEIEIAPCLLGAVFYLLYRLFAPKIKFSLPEDTNKKIESEVPHRFLDESEQAVSDEPIGEPEPEDFIEQKFTVVEESQQHKERDVKKSNRYKLLTPILIVGLAMTCARWRSSEEAVWEDMEVVIPEHVKDAQVSDQEQDLQIGAQNQPAEAGELPMRINPHNLLTINLTRQQMQYSQKGVSFFKSAFWGSIRVGNPQQEFRVLVDTGSGHLVLPSTFCSSETCRAHRRYRRSRSESARDIDGDGTPVVAGAPRDQLTVSFGTGHITGVFVDDVMCLKSDTWQDVSASNENLPVGCMRMRIIITTEMSEDPFKQFHFDGILGLGLEPLAQAPRFNFMTVLSEELKGKPDIAPEIFSVFLAANSKENSAVFLGGYHQDRMDGELRWSPVKHPEQGHWMVQIVSMFVDGEPVTFCSSGCRAAVDTGTSLLAVPTKAFPEVFELLRHPVPDSGACLGQGPSLEIVLEGDVRIVLEPEDYSRRDYVRSQGRKWGDGQGKVQRNTYCKPMLMAMDIPEPIGPKLFILGEPVLRKYYTVYDTAKLQVGFSKAKHMKDVETENPDDASWFLDD